MVALLIVFTKPQFCNKSAIPHGNTVFHVGMSFVLTEK